MPVVMPDTRDAEDMGAHEPATYRAKIESCEAAKGKEKGTAMIVPNFAISTPDGKKFHRKAYLVVEGAGAGGFEQLLRACHLDSVADALRASGPQPFDTDVLVGQEVNVILNNEEYKGQMRDSINGFLRI